MGPRTFLSNFTVLASAPGGIARTREAILGLAVTGRLVEQHSAEEPVTEVLAQIEKEHRDLRKSNAQKKAKSRRKGDAQRPTLDFPPSWRWAAAEEITQPGKTITYGILKPVWVDEGVPTVRVTEMKTGNIDVATLPRCSVTRAEKFAKTTLAPGDLLISKDGTIGKTAFVPSGLEGGNITQHVLRFSIHDLLVKEFVRLVIDSPYAQQWMKGETRGVALKGVNVGDFRRMPLPMPPVPEQRRIVAKVDELMALCDELEEKQNERRTIRVAARTSCLGALTSAQTPDDLARAWTRVKAHWPDLTSHPDDICPLRDALLELAIAGRLVSRDPGEETAWDILNSLGASALDEGVPFPAPANWAWARFEDLTDIGAGVTKGRKLAGREVEAFPYLRVANVQAGWLKLDVMKTIEIPVEELEKYRVLPGDVLLTEGGDWDKLGRSAVWGGEVDPCLHQNHVFRARPRDARVKSRWLSAFTNSPIGRKYFQSCSKQTTNLASINKTQLRACPVPLPPAAEQDRILKKLDELMALCDELERTADEREAYAQRFALTAIASL